MALEVIKAVFQYVQIDGREDLKIPSVEYLLGISGSEIHIKSIFEVPEILVGFISLLDDRNIAVAKDASLFLINVSSYETGATMLTDLDVKRYGYALKKLPKDPIKQLLKHIFDIESHVADQCCMTLSNLTRHSHLVEKIVDAIETSDKSIEELIDVFTKNQYNKYNAKLHYLGPVLSNLTQSHKVRMQILNKDKCLIQKLIPFTEYKDSLVRRSGVVGALKNCCFETDFHEWLLSSEVDILPRLLLPLAGNEEFDDEDNDKLPLDLQYLPADKTREEDPDIRSTLLEAITQLVSKRVNREYIRDKNTYVILRELHKWEKDAKTLTTCENLVDILIRTEEEIGEDNLKEVEVPQDLQNKFTELQL